MNTKPKIQNQYRETKRHVRLMPGILILMAGLSLAACTSGSSPAIPISTINEAVAQDNTEDSAREVVITSENEDTTMDIMSEPSDNPIQDFYEGILSEEEIDGLVFMREEEKLARDVYLSLYETWGLPIFKNIADSEQSHTDAVQSLLARYDLRDPVTVDELGIFVNPDLQALYDQLIIQGEQSLSEALRVGGTIEEIDILDLEQRLAQTDESAIQSVYENLLTGSQNHLRAFASQLEAQTGEAYQPQYLTQDEFESIVLKSAGQRGQGGRGGNGSNGRNG